MSNEEQSRNEPIEDRAKKTSISEEDYICLLKEFKKTKISSHLKSSFLMNVGQEIRTSLIALQGYSDILEKQMVKQNNIDCIHSIKEVLASFEQVLGEIVTISKIEESGFHFSKQAIDINKFCYDLHNVYAEIIKDKGIQFFFNFPVELPLFFADQIRLKQILTNLINNSIRHTEAGSIHLFVSLKKGKAKNKNMLSFNIQDTGSGIDPFVLSKIQRALSGSSNIDCIQSLGFSLSICLNLLVLMDGIISIESNTNEGTSVTVEIPFQSSTEKIKDTNLSNYKITQDIAPVKPYHNKIIVLFSNSVSLFDELSNAGESIGLNTICIQNENSFRQLVERKKISNIIGLFFDNDDFEIEEFDIKNFINSVRFLKHLPFFVITSHKNTLYFNKETFSDSLIRPISMQNLSSVLKPFTERTKSIFHSIPKHILVSAQNEILPQLNSLSGGYPIQEIKSIALNINNFATKENISFLADLSETLKRSADVFDVQKIEQTLIEIKTKLLG
ncbi:MAG: HAMP domain-containing histidine kinase [Caldisericia bacterium]|nr:HAMP domain-containing histidine kinase [Caldisericia bacterium]